MDNKHRLKEAKLVLRTITDLIERIKADIAKAEEKPKLCHGDYKVKCRCNDDVMRISIDCACPDNDMMFAIAGKSVHVDPEDIHGLILKLRQMEATLLKRKQK